MKKICTIVGARPQIIKSAMVSRAIRLLDGFKEVIVHTGQHYDDNMSSVFFEELELNAPKYQLGINNCSHSEMTGRMLIKLEEIFLKEKPDAVLVYGDTNSTLAGAMAAAQSKIKIAHVEAGVRSFNRQMPEEINRVVTDHLADLLLAPSVLAEKNLINEGIHKSKIFNCGDVMLDLNLVMQKYKRDVSDVKTSVGLNNDDYILITVHREENVLNSRHLNSIIRALKELSEKFQVVFPIHPNTKKYIEALKPNFAGHNNIKVIEPLSYLEMISLQKSAALIVTDSGGLQKEAFFNNVQCLTLRNETEWPELLQANWSQLCSPDRWDVIVDSVKERINEIGMSISPYGSGGAARKIAHTLSTFLNDVDKPSN